MSRPIVRRGFLRATLGVCWTGASLLEQSVLRAAQARAQAAPGLPKLFDITRLADGVYSAIAKPRTITNCNAVIFEQSNGLLIVDTHSKPSAAVSLVSQLRAEVTQKPVRYVVNSHFHWDHSQGAGAYRRIAPQADLVSSEPTRRLLIDLGSKRLEASVDEAKKNLDGYKKALSEAKTAADKSYYQNEISQANDYIREMANYKPELPNITFDDDLILHDKAQELHLSFRGRGHTAGDVVVYSPRTKVVATGDLLHGYLPFLTDSYPNEWPRTLLKLAELDFAQVAGGHGAVQQGKQRLYQMGKEQAGDAYPVA
ncbi:MAG: MBL fold metallo-hydrolase, partial [Bryobacteraceae bacterium]